MKERNVDYRHIPRREARNVYDERGKPRSPTQPHTHAALASSFSQSSEGTNNELVKISDGFVHLHGVGHYYFYETDVTLSGGPFVFVYLWMEINNWGENGIYIATGANARDIPVTGNDRLQIVLWQYEINPTNGNYYKPLARAGGNDIQGITPVRTG
jgi:hypothetical protein